MPELSIHFGTHFAGGSERSNFPSPNLRPISQALAADKNSPSRWFDKNWRARRFNLLGAAKAQRNTLVSSKYFTASCLSASSLPQEKQPERPPAVVRQNPPQSSSARARFPVLGAPSAAPPGPGAPQELLDSRWRSPRPQRRVEVALIAVF